MIFCVVGVLEPELELGIHSGLELHWELGTELGNLGT